MNSNCFLAVAAVRPFLPHGNEMDLLHRYDYAYASAVATGAGFGGFSAPKLEYKTL